MEDNQLNEEVVETETVSTQTFTKEEVDKLLQSESDKRVSSALAKAKQKWQEELEVQKAESEKLATMTQEERIQSEIAKEKEALEAERTTFLREKMEMQTIKELANEKLPTNFASFVVADTAEQVAENIKVFKEAWSQAINEAVSARLVGKAPIEQNTDSAIGVMTKAEFGSLPYKKRESLLAQDPDLLKKIK